MHETAHRYKLSVPYIPINVNIIACIQHPPDFLENIYREISVCRIKVLIVVNCLVLFIAKQTSMKLH